MSVVERVQRSRVVRRFLRNRVAMAGLIFILFIVLVGVVSPFWTPKNPDSQDLLGRLKGPSGSYLLGTDGFGRDMLSRLIVATRVTLIAACQGVGIALAIGIPTGLLAGYVGGALDGVFGRIADAFLSLPPLILALAIVGVIGPGLTNAMIAVGVVLAPRFFRIARASASSIKQETYIEAVRAMGCSLPRIVARHVLPNASGPLLVQTSFSVGIVITAEASLSFLGLGVRPPTPSWGSMVRDGFNTIHTATFPIFPAAVMIVLTIIAFSVVGDGLRDALGRQTEVGS